MKNNSKGNKPHQMDLDKMHEKRIHVNFEEPEDYAVECPRVTIDDCKYSLFEGGSLSYATPKLLSEVIRRLKSK